MSQLNLDGNIPAGEPCPWHDRCAICWAACPTPNNLKEVDYSCGAARSFDLVERDRERVSKP